MQRLRPKFARPGQNLTQATFPEGALGFAVGDIHGRADLLEKMLDRLEAQAAASPHLKPVVIFLGDYVDRGMHSARVIDLLLSGRPHGFERHFLRGNHEQAMQAFLRDPDQGRAWLAYGGVETLLSYRVKPVSVEAAAPALEAAAQALEEALPAAHKEFLDALVPAVTIGDYFFVHAGVDPDRGIDEQAEHDLYWIRQRFLTDTRRWDKIVVHGHSPVKEAFRDHRRIAIDTGAYATGRLTAARLEANHVAFISD
jgi:serine/threonine protein phosphatase 1